MDQRDETKIVQLLLATIGDRYFRRALQHGVAFFGPEVDGRKSFDESAAFDAANRRGPLVERKRVGDAFGQRVGSVAPAVVLRFTVDVFLEVDFISRNAAGDRLLLVFALGIRTHVFAV